MNKHKFLALVWNLAVFAGFGTWTDTPLIHSQTEGAKNIILNRNYLLNFS